MPGTHPDLSIEGLTVLVTQPPILAAVDSEAPFGVPDEVDTKDVTTTFSEGATSEDTDTDGVRDEDDNCRYYDNSASNWANTGGLLSTVGNDNIGDDVAAHSGVVYVRGVPMTWVPAWTNAASANARTDGVILGVNWASFKCYYAAGRWAAGR